MEHQKRPTIWPSASRSMASAAGTLGSPGMVMISPVRQTMKPAPAETLTSRISTSKPVGRPRRVGSVENEYWVLAMQIGNFP